MLEDFAVWLEGVLAYWLRFEAHMLVWDAETPWPLYFAAFEVIKAARR